MERRLLRALFDFSPSPPVSRTRVSRRTCSHASRSFLYRHSLTGVFFFQFDSFYPHHRRPGGGRSFSLIGCARCPSFQKLRFNSSNQELERNQVGAICFPPTVIRCV